MESADGTRLPVQTALIAAAGAGEDAVRFLDRHRFYAEAAGAFLVVRTGETRVYGNAILRKGVVTWGGR
jgi:L-fucose mutarotase